MKLRSSFVSNSSSSSFIVMEGDDSNPFSKLSKNDWVDVLCKAYRSQGFSDGKIAVFNLSDKEERKAAEEEFLDFFSQWLSEHTIKGKDGSLEWNPEAFERNEEKWDDTIRSLEWDSECSEDDDGYRLGLYGYPLKKIQFDEAYVKWDEESQKFLYRPASEELRMRLVGLWDELGLTTGDEMLLCKDARTLVHFDENVIWESNGILDDADESNGFQTEGWTFKRFCEIIARELKALGKVPADADWRDLYKLVGHCCLHEG